jgi:hypothetical protein
MSDILAEDPIRLEEAAHTVKTHFSTVYRWVLRGVPGPSGNRIRLEAIRVGRAWLTSRQALARFSEALTPDLTGEAAPLPRSPGKRQKASERAAQKLAQLGI